MHWRRKWQPTPVFLPGEVQGWGHTESDMTGDLAVAVAVALIHRHSVGKTELMGSCYLAQGAQFGAL